MTVEALAASVVCIEHQHLRHLKHECWHQRGMPLVMTCVEASS